MSIKKKMGTGILAGALGLSLVGGGTWAAFNDVEAVDNTFAAGTLDLVTNEEALFNVSNLKPGDYFTKTLELTNNGSLDINEILLGSEVSGWADKTNDKLPVSALNGKGNGANTEAEFLSQFKVTVTQKDSTIYTGNLSGLGSLSGIKMTAEGQNVAALAPSETATFDIKIEFVNNDQTYPESRLQEQNKFQGEGVDLALSFEATQMAGEDRSNN